MTNVLLVGSGAREDAIAHALIKDPKTQLYAAMSSHNPGIERLAKDAKILQITDAQTVVNYATKSRTELAIIGPEAPLVNGLANALDKEGVVCVGPSKELAAIEGNKTFCRELLTRHNIPGNPQYRLFKDLDSAEKFLQSSGPVAIKPIGLTGGKGVKITGEDLPTKQTEINYVRRVLADKIGGDGVLIEEKLDGEEYSLQAFVDGRDIHTMPLVQDHKRAFENDLGPNTGGMGSFSDSDHLLPFVSQADVDQSHEIMRATIGALQRDLGLEYKGIIYGQFMLAKSANEDKPSPKLVEFNCRFGDPEAMNVLSILESSLVGISERIIDGNLTTGQLRFRNKATVCKYFVPNGYPNSPSINEAILLDENSITKSGVELFYASVEVKENQVLTTTSRTVALLGVGDTIDQAERQVEAASRYIKGPLRHRKDIGTTALIAKRMNHMRTINEDGDNS